MLERPLCDRRVAGSIPGRVIPKTLKTVPAALSLGTQHQESRTKTGQLSFSIMWLGGISCQSVWGVIFQWGSTLKVNIELPVTSRHRRDMTERLLKATLNPNQTIPSWEEGSSCFAFLCFVVCVLSVMVYLLFLLVSLVGYDLWLWLFLDIFYNMVKFKDSNTDGSFTVADSNSFLSP